jgi:hypothetical protein
LLGAYAGFTRPALAELGIFAFISALHLFYGKIFERKIKRCLYNK